MIFFLTCPVGKWKFFDLSAPEPGLHFRVTCSLHNLTLFDINWNVFMIPSAAAVGKGIVKQTVRQLSLI